ncbi:MAG: glycine betaine ABC transporter substrate-binding protein [Archaeoglobaceae archaeon]
MNMEKYNLKKLIPILALVLVAILTAGCAQQPAEETPTPTEGEGTATPTETEVEDKGTITLGIPPWSAPPVKGQIIKQILEDEGYEVELQNLEIGIVYQQMATDNMDCTPSAWLPVTHKEYWDQYQADLEMVKENEPDTFLGLVVPQYVCDEGVTSIPDLEGNADKFNGEIIGIEPGAGIMNNTEVALKEYGLEDEYDLKPSSTSAMLASLESAINKEEWIVVPLWQPHGAYAQYELCNLESPKAIYQEGEGDYVGTVCRDDFQQDFPEAYDFFKEFEITAQTQSDWIYEYNIEGKDPEVVASEWIENNQDTVEEWKAALQ